MKILDMVYAVLEKFGRPMTPKEIYSKIEKSGMWRNPGKTPADSIGAALYLDVKEAGTRFKQVGRGSFFLKPDNSKAGCVYVLKNPKSLKNENWLKIGFAKESDDRLGNLNSAVPYDFELVAELHDQNYQKIEKFFHKMLRRFRVNDKHEFFLMTPEEAIDDLEAFQELHPDAKIVYGPDYRRAKLKKNPDKRSAKCGFSVRMPTGTVIAEDKAKNTFAKTIVALGVKRVSALGCTTLLSKDLSDFGRYKDSAVAIGGGWFVNTHSSTKVKIAKLTSIAKKLGVAIKVKNDCLMRR